MALINDASQQPPASDPAAAAAPPPDAGAPPAQAGQQGPDAQRIIIAATKLIHDPKVAAQLVEMMKAAGDPATALAQATTTLMKLMAEKSRGTMPPEAAMQALPQVISLVAELAHTAGIFDATPDVAKQAGQMILQDIQKSGQQGAAPAQGAAPPAAGAPPAGAMQQPPMGA